MNITIVLPWYDYNLPSGGILNMYGYAERLACKGHKITILYDCGKGKGKLKIPNIITYNKRRKKTISKKKLYKKKNITEIAVYSINDKTVPDGDFVIATALITVGGVNGLSKCKGKKVYFIQGFENWGISDREVYKTYELGMINIAVSSWLYNIVKEHTFNSAYYLPNAVDDDFGCDNAIEERNNIIIGFMYVPIKSKGTYDVLESIEIIHRKYPTIKFEAFGVYSVNDELLKYVRYTYNPTRVQLRDLYNRCSIFVTASWLEGFGLTAAESMKCGCCLVTTDSKGIRDFSFDCKTALICKPRDVKGLTKKIEMAINENDRRIEIANAGVKIIENFNWDKNVSQLEKILKDNL